MLVRYCPLCKMHLQLISVGKKEGFIHDPAHATAKASPFFFLDSPKPRQHLRGSQSLSTAAIYFHPGTVLLPMGSPEWEGENYWPQNMNYSFAAFSFHSVAAGRSQTWPTLVKYAFSHGLLDRALCLILTDKTSAGVQVGTGQVGLSVDGTKWSRSYNILHMQTEIGCYSFDAM